MKSRISIQRVRRVRTDLKTSGLHVSVTNLARRIDVTRRSLALKFANGLSWLAKEIEVEKGCRWNTRAIHELYITTAEFIRENGGLPSYRSLSKALKKPESTVYAYLRCYPQLVLRIDLVSNEYEHYYNAYRELIRDGASLGRKQLATKARVHRDTLARFLKRAPQFLEECPLSEDKRWAKRRANSAQ